MTELSGMAIVFLTFLFVLVGMGTPRSPMDDAAAILIKSLRLLLFIYRGLIDPEPKLGFVFRFTSYSTIGDSALTVVMQ
jgi:hypothetical protein